MNEFKSICEKYIIQFNNYQECCDEWLMNGKYSSYDDECDEEYERAKRNIELKTNEVIEIFKNDDDFYSMLKLNNFDIENYDYYDLKSMIKNPVFMGLLE